MIVPTLRRRRSDKNEPKKHPGHPAFLLSVIVRSLGRILEINSSRQVPKALMEAGSGIIVSSVFLQECFEQRFRPPE
jgi:hypothetical protein